MYMRSQNYVPLALIVESTDTNSDLVFPNDSTYYSTRPEDINRRTSNPLLSISMFQPPEVE
jgi:hypothetical protein